MEMKLKVELASFFFESVGEGFFLIHYNFKIVNLIGMNHTFQKGLLC